MIQNVNLTANLARAVRREVENGVEYVVSPVVLIVPGVLKGSGGPLLYPLDELTRNVSAWDRVPLTFGHPFGPDGVTPVSVGQADSRYRIGQVRNPSVATGSLRAEAWLDVEAVRRHDPRILTAVENGERVEVSTGLFLDVNPVQGEYRGVHYSGIARNYRPDHLAVLASTPGACSVKDGCGLNVMNCSCQQCSQQRRVPMSANDIDEVVNRLLNRPAHSTIVYNETDLQELLLAPGLLPPEPVVANSEVYGAPLTDGAVPPPGIPCVVAPSQPRTVENQAPVTPNPRVSTNVEEMLIPPGVLPPIPTSK